MKKYLLLGTSVGLLFATAALGQTPSGSTNSTTSNPKQPSSSSTPNSTAPSSSQPAAASPNTTQQSQPATSTTSQPASPPAQTATPANPSGGTAATTPAQPSTPATNTTSPSATTTPQQPAAGNTNSGNAATGSPNSTAQQPAAANSTAQPSTSNNVNASVNINDQQRTQVVQSITRLNVQPLNNVNFSLSVGIAVPSNVRLQTLPPDVISIVPQYRGYSFFVVRDEVVIVDPSTYKIVTVLPRSGGATAVAPAPQRARAAFTDRDREVVRKHVRTYRERQTAPTSSRVVVRRGERVPDAVEIEEFPATVYREAPALREYRYIHRENRTYLVDPRERIVIDEID